MLQSTRTVHLPRYSYARYIVVDGVAYRNTAAMPTAPVLAKIVPKRFPGQQGRG